MSELHTEKFAAGQVIFNENDNPETPCMYDVIAGRVGIYADYGKHNQKLLTTIDPDNDECFFGEMNLVDHAPRSTTAVALESSTLRVITEKDLQHYFEVRPMFVLSVMQHMSSRLRSLTEQYADACHVIAQQNDNGGNGGSSETLLAKIKRYTDEWNDEMAETEKYLMEHPQISVFGDSMFSNRWY